MMANLHAAWTWIGQIDQALVIVFVPLLIVLMVKVRRLENATMSSQGAVNVAVSAPSVIPMQTMTTEPSCQRETDQPPLGRDKNDPFYIAFH